MTVWLTEWQVPQNSHRKISTTQTIIKVQLFKQKKLTLTYSNTVK